MAAKDGNLDPTTSGSRGIARALFRQQAETLDQIEGAGYFNDFWTELRGVELMDVLASDGVSTYALVRGFESVELVDLGPLAAARSGRYVYSRTKAMQRNLSAFDAVTIGRWSDSSRLAPAVYAKVASEPTTDLKFQDSKGNWFEIAEREIDITMVGAMGDCTAPGVGTNDATAIQRAFNWLHLGDFRTITAKGGAGYRFRVASAIVSGTNPVIGARVIFEAPITPDAVALNAITLQNMRDSEFKLFVQGGGLEADYRTLAPGTPYSQAVIIKGCRRVRYDIRGNSYIGRLLLVDCIGGHFKNSFHVGRIECGDRSDALLATQCGQAIFVQGETGSTAVGCFYINTAWSRWSPIFDSVVDVIVPHAEFGPLNADVGVNSAWEWRGCGSIWLGQMLGGDEAQKHTMMKFTTNAGGGGCRRVFIDLLQSVQALNALVVEGMQANSGGLVVNKLVTNGSGGAAVVAGTSEKVRVIHHSSIGDLHAINAVGNISHLDYYLEADETLRDAILVDAALTSASVLDFKGRSSDGSKQTVNAFSHAKIDSTGARVNFIDFTMQGASMLACFDIAGTSGSNGVRIRGGRYETTTKFDGGIEANSIDGAQGILSKAWGTARIVSGTSSIVVTHGMFGIPSQVFLQGTHAEVSDTIPTSIGATQFTVTAPANVTADRDVYWHAVRRP